MKAIFVLGAIVALSEGFHQEFHEFKLAHERVYDSPREEAYRLQVFSENMKKVQEHNARFQAGLETYELGMNQFGDMTDEEFIQQTSCLDMPTFNFTDAEVFKAPAGFQRPASVDWVARGAVNSIRNQKQCGSCWAFTSTECLESIIYLATGKMLTLSPQNLVDCAKPYGVNGCHGGYMNRAYAYVAANGIMLDSDYPYTAAEGACRFNPSKSVLQVRGSQIIQGEDSLQDAIASKGPIGVGVDAKEWKLYAGGVYAPKMAFKKLTHGVVAVGYGTANGEDYYTLRNSYGPNWGEKGFIRIARNRNNAFGVANAAVVPVL